MSKPDSRYAAYYLWESDPVRDPDHKARLHCLYDMNKARELQLRLSFILVMTIILTLLIYWSRQFPFDGWSWGIPISIVVMASGGIYHYTRKHSVLMARLKGMVVKCWNPKKCGKQIRGDYEFCPFCGYRLPSPAPPPESFDHYISSID